MSSARQVEASLGLLADLYAALSIARHDSELTQIGRTIALVHAEAERVALGIAAIIEPQPITLPGAMPWPAEVRHPALIV